MAKNKPDWNGAYCRYHFWQWSGAEEYEGGRTPLMDVRKKLKENKELAKLTKLEKLSAYNKAVLARTTLSTTTMYWTGTECFLIEEFSNGTHRVSLSTTSRDYMKTLFKSGRVMWLREDT
jgi:hypothetical protein